VHKKEIISLRSKIEGEHLTMVPLSLYTIGSFVKLEIALAKGKKQYEKREAIKKRDIQKQQAQDLAEEFDKGY